jgi:exosome complex exonuclease RRP6
MDASEDFKSLYEKVQTALVASTKASNRVVAEDLNFHKASDPAVEEQLDETTSRLLSLSSSLLTAATKGTDLRVSELDEPDDVDAQWTRIVDVVDTLLEKADTCLDEYTGLIKRKAAPTDEGGPPLKKNKPQVLEPSVRRANIVKPQNSFEVKPDNLDTSPWKPQLTTKPHANVALQQSVVTFTNESNTVQ